MIRAFAGVAMTLLTLCTADVRAQDERERALAMFEQGVAEYEAGRFGAAAELFQEANDVYPEPILLYNLARAQESLGRLEEAAASYREYLRSDPEDRPAVEARLVIIDSRLEDRMRLQAEATEQAERASRAEESQSSTPGASSSRAGPVALISIGSAAALAGGALVVVGQIQGGGINDEDRPLDEAMEQRESAVRLNRAGFIVGSVGLALVVGGIAWLAGARSDDGDALAFRF